MSSKLNYRAIIDDVQSEKCSDEELANLLEIFEYAVKSMATTLACKAWFDLNDFATAKKRGVDGFMLVLDKYPHAQANQWKGTFEKAGRTVKVFCTLEKDQS